MLRELTDVFRLCSLHATRPDYLRALVEDNCLGKPTFSSRQQTLQRLTELYALDPAVPLFRLLRFFWSVDEKAHPQLALLAAMARDPLLRATTPVVLSMEAGEEIARQKFTNALRLAVGDRLNDATLDKVVRNTASSWTQSGHLEGRSRKKRVLIQPTAGSVAYALILDYMLGARGRALINSFFASILDRDESALTSLVMEAKRFGFLDVKSGGGMIVVSFDAILTEQERRIVHGTH